MEHLRDSISQNNPLIILLFRYGKAEELDKDIFEYYITNPKTTYKELGEIFNVSYKYIPYRIRKCSRNTLKWFFEINLISYPGTQPYILNLKVLERLLSEYDIKLSSKEKNLLLEPYKVVDSFPPNIL